jgi:hemoglobin
MTAPTPNHFDVMGGEAGIRRLVDRFYDLMDHAPEAANVRALHAASLKQSREKLYLYLMGWTGGPPTYVERYGHPRLRMRHMPFTIGTRERDEWLWCMERALAEHDLPADFRDELWQKLRNVADFMRNQSETDGGLPTV